MIETALLFFIFLLPFQFALHPFEGIDLALARVLAAAIFLLWAARSLAAKRFIVPPPRPLFFFLAFLLWATLSLLWAGNTFWALRKVLFLWSFFPLFLVFAAALQNPRFRENIFRCSAGAAALAALLALLPFFSQFIIGVESVFAFWVGDVLPFFLGPAFSGAVASYPSLLVNVSGVTVMRASGFFPDPHMFAFFLGMSLPLAIALAFEDHSRKRGFWLACAGIILITDLLTFSRGGYLGLISGLSVFFLPLLLSFTQRRKQMFRIGMLVIIAGSFFFSPVGARFLSSFSQSDGSNVERLRLWEEAAFFIGERPWLGTGLGNYPLLVKPSAEYREPIYAHNLFLDIALETGLIGLLFFAGFLFSCLSSAWREWRKEREMIPLALFSALTVFSVHALFETPLYSVQVLPLFFLLAAASVYYRGTGTRRKGGER